MLGSSNIQLLPAVMSHGHGQIYITIQTRRSFVFGRDATFSVADMSIEYTHLLSGWMWRFMKSPSTDKTQTSLTDYIS